MSNVVLHRKAIVLRKQKKSYSQIKSILGVSKSTLSAWLRAYPLTREEINNLRANSEIRIEKYRQTMKKKRDERFSSYLREEKQKYLPLSKRGLLVAGLFLYWGEGNKASRCTISVNNTDPKLVQFALYWMLRALNIPLHKIRVYVHLYADMNVQAELKYWSRLLGVPLRQFVKPYIKASKRSEIDQKGFGHGTCGVRAENTVIKERILAAIQVIADHYVRKLS